MYMNDIITDSFIKVRETQCLLLHTITMMVSRIKYELRNWQQIGESNKSLIIMWWKCVLSSKVFK